MPSAISQMYEQSLDAVKGWFHLSALDKTAKLSAACLARLTTIPAGRVAVLDDAGEFVLDRTGGLDGTVTAKTTAMPIFLWQGSGDADVRNIGTSATAKDSNGAAVVNWTAISPSGAMNGLVATGGYELQTTEFDTGLPYLPNQALTASTSGVLTSASATQYTNWICGICSTHVNADNQAAGLGVYRDTAGSPVGHNANGIQTLTFWSYFLPAAA